MVAKGEAEESLNAFIELMVAASRPEAEWLSVDVLRGHKWYSLKNDLSRMKNEYHATKTCFKKFKIYHTLLCKLFFIFV